MTNREIEERLKVIIAEHNPCGFHTVESARWNYREARLVVGEATGCHGGTPCCHGCRHLTKGGCNLKKAIACRFYFCNAAWHRLAENLKQEITDLGKAYTGLLYFRESIHSHPKHQKPIDYPAPFVYR